MDDRVRMLRETLYLAAKADRNRRFHALFDKVCRKDILSEAWNTVERNGGTHGIDNVRIQDIENSEEFIQSIAQELKQHTYKPSPVRKVLIPKSNGKMRALGIPTVKDRVVQTAVKLVVEPIFESDFEDCSFGFRPDRSAHDAVDGVVKYLNFGCEHIIDADISGCFDNIPKHPLMMSVARRIVDGSTLALIRSFLDAGVMDNNEFSDTAAGTPQGSPISPLLANIYLDHLDKRWKSAEHTTETHLIRYCDDFVILGMGSMEKEMELLREIMGELQLQLSGEKTRLTTAEQGFDFLGFHFVRHYSAGRRKRTTRWIPSKRARTRIKENIRQKTDKSNLATTTPYDAKQSVTRTLTGWYQYFRHSMSTEAFTEVHDYAELSIGRMFSRWKQRKHIGKRRKLERQGLTIDGPPPAMPYRISAGAVR